MTALNKQAHQTENERMAQSLAERNGEPVEGLRQRISELEEIATDYGMKFQKAQDALKHQALRHKSQLEAAEKRIAEQSEIVAAAEKLVRCKGRYHSELNYRALAKLFGVTTPDLPPLKHENVHYADAAEMEIAALRQRIAELEARTITVKFEPIPMEELGNRRDGKKHPYMFGAGYNSAVVHCESVLHQACAAAGIGVKGE